MGCNIAYGKGVVFMLEAVAYGILLLAAVVGFATILGVVERWLLRPVRKMELMTVLPLSGHVEDVELLTRQLRRKHSGAAQHQLILVDNGMDGETRKICEALCRDFADVSLCEKGQLDTRLKAAG